MTKEEFESYLKSIGGLKSGYNVDHIIDSPWFFEFNVGWYDITKQLIDDLIKLGWNKKLLQAKEKFGTGRFYIAAATDEVWRRIEVWEQQTAHTCELCGSQEEVFLRGDTWYQTLCDNCWNKKQNI